MASYEINLRELQLLAIKYPHILGGEEDKEIGDETVVVCSTDEFADFHALGKVKYHGSPVTLRNIKGKKHPDGKKGEVFVQSWNKAKDISSEKLPGKFFL